MEEEQAVELKSKMERLNVAEWHEDDGNVFVGDVLIERLANVLILSDDDLKAHIAERLGEPLSPSPVAAFLGVPLVAPVEVAPEVPAPVESVEEVPLVPDAEA